MNISLDEIAAIVTAAQALIKPTSDGRFAVFTRPGSTEVIGIFADSDEAQCIAFDQYERVIGL